MEVHVHLANSYKLMDEDFPGSPRSHQVVDYDDICF